MRPALPKAFVTTEWPGMNEKVRASGAARFAADQRQGGFTLIELLVVIALAALLLLALSGAKLKAQAVSCRSKLKQLQLAWIMYPDDNNERVVRNGSGQAGVALRQINPSIAANPKLDGGENVSGCPRPE